MRHLPSMADRISRHSIVVIATTLLVYATLVSSQNMQLNIQHRSSTTVRVGFSYASRTWRYLVSAKEWIDGRRKQTVSTSEKFVGNHVRSATLSGLTPGREYLIEVQPMDRAGRPLGSAGGKVVQTILRCYICDGRASNNECNRRSIQSCPVGTDACLNEMRYQNGIITLTKRCAQFQPLLARTIQNGRDVTRACSGIHAKDAVCQCMCKSDSCNKAPLPCSNECFETLAVPIGGTIQCTDGKNINSLCRWSCPGGSNIIGVTQTRCRTDRTWSVLTPPKCVKPVIMRSDGKNKGMNEVYDCPKLLPPSNGKMSCTSGHRTNSLCSFSCDSGHAASGGSKSRRCLASGRWSGSRQTCKVVTCPNPVLSSKRVVDCDDGYEAGSVCEISCPAPLSLNGVNRVSCLKSGRWSRKLPTCERRGCLARPRVSTNVIAECHDFSSPRKGASCDYSCKMGFRLQGSSTVTCSNDRWSGAAPNCYPVRCQPALGKPTFGIVRCSRSNNYNSKCTFSCNPNYVLSGAQSVTCGATGRWSAAPPICASVRCAPISNVRNGFYSCNRGRDRGSVCTFDCLSGYGFEAGSSSKIRCNTPKKINPKSEFKGVWSSRIPSCEAIRCPKLKLSDKLSIQCTKSDSQSLGSSCKYICEPGYSVIGGRSTICGTGLNGKSLGRWSISSVPRCQRRQCRTLGLLANGKMVCTEGTFAGSVCTAQCNHGYSVNGNPDVRCRLDGRWNRRNPRCSRIICKVPATPPTRHLQFQCGGSSRSARSKQFYLDYQCPLACSAGYTLNGSNRTACGDNGKWIMSASSSCDDTNECRAANGGCEHICKNSIGSYTCHCRENYRLRADGKTCRLVVCPPLSEDARRVLKCSDNRMIGSRCVISCVAGYEPVAGASVIRCRDDGTWNQKHAVCAKIRCPLLRSPSNGIMTCTGSNRYESVCSHGCNEGYELMGTEEITCTSQRSWTNPAPKCRKIQCDEERTDLSNGGAVCTDSNFYLSKCRYFCNAGYQFAGEVRVSGTSGAPSSTCLSDGTWSSSAVTCEKKLCSPTVSNLIQLRPNGDIECTDDNRFESVCAIACPSGYRLIGQSRVSCTQHQTWTNDLGYCGKVRCPLFRPIRDGSIECTEQNYYESVCSFTCEIGHDLIGSSKSSCQADRTWTKSLPRCQRVTCDESRLFVRNGEVKCTDENFYSTQCVTTCNAGYEFDEKTTLENLRKTRIARLVNLTKGGNEDVFISHCLHTGEWDAVKPICVKHSCVPSAAFLDSSRQNGEVTCTDGEFYLSECTLRCAVGYEIVGGTDSTQCGTIRQWTTQLGHCARVKCVPFTAFQNGVMTCSNSFSYESLCEFSCNPGYDLIGDSSSTCQADRTFTNAQPVCQKINCPKSHTSLANGAATCTDGTRFESSCSYVCNPGYEMIGNTGEDSDVAVVTCRANRKWEGTLPECRRKQCSKHDGSLSKAKLNGVVECTESVWFGSRCTVTCNRGYRLIGPATTRCTATADWAPTIGYCERIECPGLKVPSNSAMDCTNEFRFESVCSFECTIGYELIGSTQATCQADKTYDNKPPTCRQIICTATFLAMDNGRVTCTKSNRFASVCSYKCDDGYQLTSDSAMQATCLATYRWDAEIQPTCEKKRCSQADSILLKALEQGKISCTDSNRFESICSLTCNTGYVLTEGVGSTQCLADRSWKSNLGFCIKKRCPAFLPLNNGAMSCTEKNKFDSVCTFACNDGYELVGESASRCQADQTFTNPMPSCRKTICPETHLSIENGNTTCTESNLFESVCEYQCFAGYEVTGGRVRSECEADQEWSAAEATCEKKICESNDENLIRAERNGRVTCTEGHVFDSVCSVLCDSGYQLVAGGKITTRCNENAEWEPAIGYCVKIQCPAFDTLNNGLIGCSEANLYLSACTFKCTSGYEMDGSSTSVCQADRTWTSVLPTCSRVSCSDDYLNLENGVANCSRTNKFESVCKYQCNRGYEMPGTDSNTSTCTEFRTWTNIKPTCSKKKCPLNDLALLKAEDTGSISCTEANLFESVCSVTCPVGYELVGGERDITCLDTANWDSTIGFCQKIQCGSLHTPSNSDMECTDDDRYQSVCTFVCHEGYYMDGVSETVCQADRTYSKSVPECKKINCSRGHLSIEFGTVECSEENLFESVCAYQCQTGYQFFDTDYVTEEVMTSTCLANTKWSEEVPICEKVTCPHDDEAFVLALTTGDVSCTEGNRYGSQCTISCNKGYDIVGQIAITCLASGSWNDSIGSCEVARCPQLDQPSFGNLSCSNGNEFSSHCDFSCEEGYQFTTETAMMLAERDPSSSAVQVMCLADASWSIVSTPQCEPKECPSEGWTFLQNGNITCTDSNLYASQCLFQCDVGYEVIQPVDTIDVTSVLVTCSSDGQWNIAEPPRCRKIRCQQNVTELQEMQPHGKITCTNESYYQSECTLECHKGYHLVGFSDSTQCESDREWSVILETCKKDSCPPLLGPGNGTVTCTDGFLFKSHCFVKCDPGYEVVDPEDEYDVNGGISCRSDGTWCGVVPTCAEIQCPMAQSNIQNGNVVCTHGNSFRSECSYTCDMGYHMVQGQSSVITCGSDKMWSDHAPICENNRCPANDTSLIEARINGDVTCTNENKFGSRCLLKCYDGYEMSGEPTTSCLYDGDWSNGLGLCQRIECEPLEPSPHSTLQCTNQFVFQSLCLYKCDEGYERVMSPDVQDITHDIKCEADRTWAGRVVQCQKKTCPTKGFDAIEHGDVQCTDGLLFGTRCIYICGAGYEMQRSVLHDSTMAIANCTASGAWDMDAPVCMPSQCSPTVQQLRKTVADGTIECTNGSAFGSRCSLKCECGYRLVGDSSETVCGATGEWWPKLSNCERVECPQPVVPEHTTIECTDSYRFDSTCQSTGCDPGYVLSSEEDDIITCAGEGSWLGALPACKKRQCSSKHITLQNGAVTCTDVNNFGSSCEAYCNEGYVLTSSSSAFQCMETGDWSGPQPVCAQRLSCSSAYFPFGTLRCSQNNRCELSCDPGTELVGAGESTCNDQTPGIVQWNPRIGFCKKIRCPSLSTLVNGITVCSDNMNFRSYCRFRCEEGFRLIGDMNSRCRADARWTANVPQCVETTCQRDYLEIENGAVFSSNEASVGSVAIYSCSDGYELIGALNVTCQANGAWRKTKPSCQPTSCPPLQLNNGQMECSGSRHNEQGSMCTFRCDESHQLQGNYTSTLCQPDGTWSNPEPYCKGHCDVQFDSVADGGVSCTNGNYHRSQCRFWCNSDPYDVNALKLRGSPIVTCQENGKWNYPPPCCARPCPSQAKIDLYFALDSSETVGFKNWTRMLNFVNTLISSFPIGPDGTQVGVVRYNRYVDVREEIPIGKYETLSSLQRAIRFLPYGGRGTNTGRALSYLTDNSLASSSNRPDARDYVILVTDGASQDDIVEPSTALKSMATTYAVGVGSVNQDQLRVIASKPSNVYLSDTNFGGLNDQLASDIIASLCENPCLMQNHWREQASSYLTLNES